MVWYSINYMRPIQSSNQVSVKYSWTKVTIKVPPGNLTAPLLCYAALRLKLQDTHYLIFYIYNGICAVNVFYQRAGC